MASDTILVIRMGAMGDIIHTLPAVASLKASFPKRKIAWLMAERWKPLVQGNPAVDEVIVFDRSSLSALRKTRAGLLQAQVGTAIDFQGLVQSALAGRAARPRVFLGMDRSQLREKPAALFYTAQAHVTGPHRVERSLQLAAAAGATSLTREAWIPAGESEGDLPEGPFVLMTPFAGWAGKEWPLECLDALGERLRREGIELVANVAAARASEIRALGNVHPHVSSLAGLINATRRAAAVVAPDSGPLHLAAALRKPGVALFGPTDPATNGPFGGTMTVLRAPDVETTYERHKQTHPSMRLIAVDQVMTVLMTALARQESGTR